LPKNPLALCCDFFLVEGMNLAHLTGEAAIQGTEVALGVWTQVMLKTLGTTCM